MRQVISIAADGTMSGLQKKPGQGIDLTQFGTAKVERASEIMWEETSQAWYVLPLKGAYANSPLTEDDWTAYLPWPPARLKGVQHGTRTLLFSSYDDAVAAEIAFLDEVRLVRGAEALV